MEAFLRLGNQFPISGFFWWDAFEDEDSLSCRYSEDVWRRHSRVIFAGPVQDTALTMRLRCLGLPSHREGLPRSSWRRTPLQTGGRCVGDGDRNLVMDGETGLLFPVGDVPALAVSVGKAY